MPFLNCITSSDLQTKSDSNRSPDLGICIYLSLSSKVKEIVKKMCYLRLKKVDKS